jgi:hypothetical protein
VDAALWPIIVFAIKLLVVGASVLMLAVTLWMLQHALRHGVVLQTKPGPIRTRAETPLSYWLYIVWHVLFAAATVVMIHAFIQLGERRDQPASESQRPAPARPVDESHDRAGFDGRVQMLRRQS